jgi:hypothetical protein
MVGLEEAHVLLELHLLPRGQFVVRGFVHFEESVEFGVLHVQFLVGRVHIRAFARTDLVGRVVVGRVFLRTQCNAISNSKERSAQHREIKDSSARTHVPSPHSRHQRP